MIRTTTYPPQPPRYANGGYRYFFNGQEADNEVLGDGALHAFEYRMHDTRIGRFWSVDPLAGKFPWNSVYAFAENRVVDGRELEGLEWDPNKPLHTTQENISIRVVSASDQIKVEPPVSPKIEMRLQMYTKPVYSINPGEIRPDKSEYEKWWEFTAGPFANTIRTNKVLQATSSGIFTVATLSYGEMVFTQSLPYVIDAAKSFSATSVKWFGDTRVKIGIGVMDGVVSYKLDFPPALSWPDPVVTFTSQITQLGIKQLVKNSFFDDLKTKQDTNDNLSKKP